MRIGKAAREIDVSPSTLRRLDRAGLIVIKRDKNGDRFFTQEDLEIIRAILFPECPGERRPIPVFQAEACDGN